MLRNTWKILKRLRNFLSAFSVSQNGKLRENIVQKLDGVMGSRTKTNFFLLSTVSIAFKKPEP
jgi:hypothetical protein